jgi:hypothetical protein
MGATFSQVRAACQGQTTHDCVPRRFDLHQCGTIVNPGDSNLTGDGRALRCNRRAELTR